MKDWWMSLQSRERMVLIAAAVIIIAALIYLLIVEPVTESSTALTNRINAHQQTLIWMQQASQQVKQLRSVSGKPTQSRKDQRSLLAIIDSSARRRQLRKPIQRMDPEGKDGVKLWIENADFDKLVVWLGTLQSTQGVLVTRATISRGESPGRVNSRLSLQRL